MNITIAQNILLSSRIQKYAYLKIFNQSLIIQSFVPTVKVAILPYVGVAYSLDDLGMDI